MDYFEQKEKYIRYQLIKGRVFLGIINKYNELRSTALSVKKKTSKMRSLQPYNANIIDMFSINENGHSAILEKILKYKINNQYYFLSSFIQRILGIELNFNHRELTISTEKFRIDLLIRDKNNAIIIENKINGAIDQEEQLRRYVDVAKHLGISEHNIYIIYLVGVQIEYNPRQSLSIHYDSFKKRFKLSTFSDDILEWLKEDVLTSIIYKDKNLFGFVSQYIDHLDGRYFKRLKDTAMNKKLNEYLFESIGLDKDKIASNINVLNDELKVITELQSRINQLLEEQKESIFELWFSKLNKDFPNLTIRRNNPGQLIKVGVLIEFAEGKFSVLIEEGNNHVYFGLGKHFTGESSLNTNILNISNDILSKDFKRSNWWYGWKYTNFESGYDELYSLIKEVVNSQYYLGNR